MALGDLDGDGDLDAFIANGQSPGEGNRVQINDGSGNFTDSGQSLGNHRSLSVGLGDLDGDGDLDAFVGNSVGHGNRVWNNDGSGNFTDSGQKLGSRYSMDVAVGDLDGDGDLDAFAANFNQDNRVWTNDGSGNFTDSTQSLGNHDSRDVALGDLDGDGDLDAFVANDFAPPGQRNRVWLNTNGEDFGDAPDTFGTLLGSDGARHSAMGSTLGSSRDNDADGQPTANADGDDTDGTDDEDGVTFPSTIIAGDLSADVTVNASGAALLDAWIDFNGDGTFAGANEQIFTSQPLSAGDNNLTFIVPADARQGTTFGRFRLSTSGGLGPRGSAADGEVEDHTLTIASPSGVGDFTDSGNSLGNRYSRGVSLGDVDGDGDLDAFVANRNDEPNRVWLNDGSGSFTDSGNSLGNHSSPGVSLGDVDGDGDLDAFVANRFQGNRVWLNQDTPNVTEVLVRGSAWTQPFLDELDTLSLGTDGYSIPVGSADQLDALSWSNIDEIVIRFNEQVNVDQTDLTLTGVNVATYSFSSLSTATGLTGDFEAVWTLTAPIDNDKLRIRLDGTTGGAVTDTAGNILNGEWTDTVSTYPSGDHLFGGDFAFRFNVLPADFNGDGVVTLNPDLQNLLAGNGASIGAAAYSPFIDLDGNGIVTLNPDLQKGLSNNSAVLPLGDPSAPGAVNTGTSQTTGVSTAAPSTSGTAMPNGISAALDRVIAMPSRNHAMLRHLDAATFTLARSAREARSDDVPSVLGGTLLTPRSDVDLTDLNSQHVAVDLLSEAGSIF